MEKTESAADLEGCAVETCASRLRIRWDDSAAVTAMGQRPVFIALLKTSGLLGWVCGGLSVAGYDPTHRAKSTSWARC